MILPANLTTKKDQETLPLKNRSTIAMKTKKLTLSFAILGLTAGLVGCASTPANQTFAPATEVVTKTVTVPIKTSDKVDASFGYGENPALVAAYQKYQHNGQAPTVTTSGFKAFPYEPSQQIYLTCEPMHLCTILLEQGELIRDVSLGDTSNWLLKVMTVGGANNSAKLIVLKPKLPHLATNLIITTDKRIYNMALISSQKDYVRQAIFYYPNETDASISAATNEALQQQAAQSQNVVASFNNGTNVNLANVNFNYSLSGDNPTWKPARVFDDGTHTIIQFPASVSSGVLPVLFVLHNGQDEIVNFRKKTESDGSVDYVVDQVFTKAVLVSGVGSNQDKVVITNRNLDKSWF